MNIDIINSKNFESFALQVFNHQFENNIVYQNYCNQLNINSSKIKNIEKIPFLPISFFKSQKVISSQKKIKKTFISSGTTGTKSYHYITDLNLYEKSIKSSFNTFYGDPSFCLLYTSPSPRDGW